MDTYDFNVSVERVEGDVWEFTVSQEFDESEIEMLAFGDAESQEEALALAINALKQYQF